MGVVCCSSRTSRDTNSVQNRVQKNQTQHTESKLHIQILNQIQTYDVNTKQIQKIDIKELLINVNSFNGKNVDQFKLEQNIIECGLGILQNSIYIIGGTLKIKKSKQSVRSVYKTDLDDLSNLSEVVKLNKPRSLSSVVTHPYLPIIYAIGGMDAERDDLYSSIEQFDQRSDVWNILDLKMPYAAKELVAAHTQNELIIMGGVSDSLIDGKRPTEMFESVQNLEQFVYYDQMQCTTDKIVKLNKAQASSTLPLKLSFNTYCIQQGDQIYAWGFQEYPNDIQSYIVQIDKNSLQAKTVCEFKQNLSKE